MRTVAERAVLAGAARRRRRGVRGARRRAPGARARLARQRQAIITANAELRERELIKLASLSAALAEALRERGVADPAASLAAEIGIAVFKIAFERWIDGGGDARLRARRARLDRRAEGAVRIVSLVVTRLLLLAALVLCMAPPASAKTVWLCRPGLAADPCNGSLSTTVFGSYGGAGKVSGAEARQAGDRLLLRLPDGERPARAERGSLDRSGGALDRALPGRAVLAGVPDLRAGLPPAHRAVADQRLDHGGGRAEGVRRRAAPRGRSTWPRTTTAAGSC